MPTECDYACYESHHQSHLLHSLFKHVPNWECLWVYVEVHVWVVCAYSVCVRLYTLLVHVRKAGLRNTTWAFLNSSLNGTKIPAGTRGLTCRSSETLTTPSQTGMWRFWLCRREAHSCQWRRPWYSNDRKDPQRGRIKRLNENRHLNSVVCVELYPLHEEALPSDTQVGR